MVALATIIATVIASQAMTSGVFSLTQQAVQLDYSPRLKVVHTPSPTEVRSSCPVPSTASWRRAWPPGVGLPGILGLAGAYGIVVTATMGITSVLYYFVVRHVWGWIMLKALPLLILFLTFDLTYFGANLLKIVDGGWFTLTVGLAITLAMATWKTGRLELARLLSGRRMPLAPSSRKSRSSSPTEPRAPRCSYCSPPRARRSPCCTSSSSISFCTSG